ncbi:uncharacterized protein [Gossypium hirsutum]|uniref:Integrase catalytic domain-containing protein n=1 Tax=Gossypium hirsutum TaxID=3635 RepID=A0ABM3ASQ2_GOSHI|nr:uncharacterized protein LOC121222064 [Gossypium hirsutum]
MGQLATELRNRPQGALPNDKENPRNPGNEHCKALSLKSGKTLEPNTVKDEEEPADAQDSVEVQPSVEILVPPEPKSAKSDKYILVAVDYVFKWVEVEAYPTNNVKVVTKFLQKHVFTRFGTLRAIINDEGSHFVNKWLKWLLDKYGVKHKVPKTYHLQTNGQGELANKEIKGIIEKVVCPNR